MGRAAARERVVADLGIDGAQGSHPGASEPGRWLAELGEDRSVGRPSLQAPRTRAAGFAILFIRLKASNERLVTVKNLLPTHLSGTIGPLSEIMVRLLLEMGPNGIVAEHPGKPFLLA